MGIGALALEDSGGDGWPPGIRELEATFALLRRTLQPGKGKSEGGKPGSPNAPSNGGGVEGR
eukprot:630572-Alexandrium_andersonii.AAC.1